MIKKRNDNEVLVYVCVILVFITGLVIGLVVGTMNNSDKIKVLEEDYQAIIEEKDLQIDIMLIGLEEKERILDKLIIGLDYTEPRPIITEE